MKVRLAGLRFCAAAAGLVWSALLVGAPAWAVMPQQRPLVQPEVAEAYRDEVWGILQAPTLKRDYGVRRFVGRREVFEFFLDNMDACSALAERAGLIEYRARLQPDGRFFAEDGKEAAGYLVQVYCGPNRRAYFVQGTQKGVFTASGRGVVLVDFAEVAPGQMAYTGQIRVVVDNTVVARLARAFAVFVRGSVDRNFNHVLRQPIRLTELASLQPGMLRDMIESLAPEDYELAAPLLPLLQRPGRAE